MNHLLNGLNDGVMSMMDVLFGWTLTLSPSMALLIVSVLTAAVLTIVRRFTTNQDQLHRCADDKRRLKQLIREAKGRRDKDAIRRHRSLIGRIGMVKLKAEGKPLLVSLIPIVLLAMWAFSRLVWLPPVAGETLTVRAYVPTMTIGELVHLVPQDGLDVQNGYIQRVEGDSGEDGKIANGVASWQIVAEQRDEPYVLEFRNKNSTVEHELRVDGAFYAPPIQMQDNADFMATETSQEYVKLFGLIPGIPQIYLEPWLAGYFIIAIPCVMVFRRLFHVY